MATSAWSDWDDDVLPELPGVQQAMARHHVKLAAIEFCRRSWAWIIDQGPIPVSANVAEYDWNRPANTDVARVIVAWLEGRRVESLTRKELSARFGDYKNLSGSPEYYLQDSPNKLILVPKPNSTIMAGVTAVTALQPKRAATGLETTIRERWGDVIAAGAKYRLMRMPKKPWTDKDIAAVYRQEFEDGIAQAKLEVTRSFSGARMRVRPQFM